MFIIILYKTYISVYIIIIKYYVYWYRYTYNIMSLRMCIIFLLYLAFAENSLHILYLTHP